MSNFKSARFFESLSAAFKSLNKLEQANTIKEINECFMFKLSKDGKDHFWCLDLATGGQMNSASTAAEASKGLAPPGVTLNVDDDTMAGILTEKIDPTEAFMKGKLEIEGNMMNALKLTPIINRFSHTLSKAPAPTTTSTSTPGSKQSSGSVPPLVNTIKAQVTAINKTQLAAVQKQLDCIVQFNIKDSSKTYSFIFNFIQNTPLEDTFAFGSAKDSGLVPPKLTISLKEEDFIKLRDKKLNGQAAYIQGKLQINGDIFLALKLDSVFKLLNKKAKL
ncbi:hypothetical protein BB560_001439 [Smittium megazygosporum]|uniref:SCP2 domain-containing protein n=1 Tax=Smittium megazygosporum TaxID=133381 RepID=A0A2T9ZHL1_9FUNG|nr:hypothetical protein BB560_001439 [Smittium megazygosporum]